MGRFCLHSLCMTLFFIFISLLIFVDGIQGLPNPSESLFTGLFGIPNPKHRVEIRLHSKDIKDILKAFQIGILAL